MNSTKITGPPIEVEFDRMIQALRHGQADAATEHAVWAILHALRLPRDQAKQLAAKLEIVVCEKMAAKE
ncbi:MAG: hypothetical protein WEG40_12745 [Candidatus Rokuibacteriota bacterium]